MSINKHVISATSFVTRQRKSSSQLSDFLSFQNCLQESTNNNDSTEELALRHGAQRGAQQSGTNCESQKNSLVVLTKLHGALQ